MREEKVIVLTCLKDFTSEQLRGVLPVGKGGRTRDYWANLSDVERVELSKRHSEAQSHYWAELSQEDREAIGCRRSREQRKYWDGLSSEEVLAKMQKNFLSPGVMERAHEGTRRYWASLSPEGKAKVIERMIEGHKEYWKGVPVERRRQCGEMQSRVQREVWESLTEEEKSRRIRSSYHPNEKSQPEFFLELYLEDRFPGQWGYNGDSSQGVIIGGKVPDFVSLEGRPIVIEELGIYFHPDSDESDKVEHYKKYGYGCIVVWDYQCYSWLDLNNIFEGWS